MIKKTAYIILCICFLLSINVMANEPLNSRNTQGPAMVEEMPIENGRQDNMNMPPQGEDMPDGMGFENMKVQSAQEQQSTGFWGYAEYYSTPIISVILLVFAYLFVFFYKRKNY